MLGRMDFLTSQVLYMPAVVQRTSFLKAFLQKDFLRMFLQTGFLMLVAARSADEHGMQEVQLD
jgi:hypothetical protein